MVGHANILPGAACVQLDPAPPRESCSEPGDLAACSRADCDCCNAAGTILGVGVEKCWARYWLGGILGCGVTATARNEDCPKVPKDFSTMALLNGH